MAEVTDDISCVHLESLFRFCDQRSIHTERITGNCPYPLEHLRNRTRTIPWKTFSDLFAQAGKLLDEDDLRQIGRDSWSAPQLFLYARVGKILFNTADQINLLYASDGLCSRTFPVSTEVEQLSGTTFNIHIALEAEWHTSNAFYALLAGQMEGLPETMGLPPGKVVMNANHLEAHYSLTMPKTAIAASLLHRQVNWLSDPKSLIREIAGIQRQHEELEKEYQATLAHSEAMVASLRQQTGDYNHAGHNRTSPEVPAAGERIETTRHSMSHFRVLAEMSQDCIVTIDQNNQITYANSAAGTTFDYLRSELSGMNLDELLPPALTGTHQGIRKDRTLLPLAATFSELDPDLPGDRVCIIRDITPAVLLEQKLSTLEHRLKAEQKTASLGHLASGITHDFNNILIAIRQFSELALSSTSSNRIKNYLKEIRKTGIRGEKLTQHLLNYSRDQTGTRQSLDIHAVITDVVTMLDRLLPDNITLSISLDTSDNPARVLADPIQIEQVLVNLVVNARDAMPNGGTLTISSLIYPAESGYVALEVTDTGMGMDHDTRQHIFTPLYTSKPEGRGTGLGLSVVASIVEQHGGSIEVNSTLGSGTTFRILLPKLATGTEPLAAGSPRGIEGTETILVVEADPKVRDLARLILSGTGYTILEAADGAAATQTWLDHEGSIDLVLIDIALPRMSGIEAEQVITTHSRSANILFTNAFPEDSEQSRLILQSGRPVIRKPYLTDTLREAVRRSLDGAHNSKNRHLAS